VSLWMIHSAEADVSVHILLATYFIQKSTEQDWIAGQGYLYPLLNVVMCNRCRNLCRKNAGQPVVCARTHQPQQNESSTKTQSSPPSILFHSSCRALSCVVTYLKYMYD
jgi:hypothetical protein